MGGPKASNWSNQGIDAVLEFLPIFEAADFESCTWPKLEPRMENGVQVTPMPYPVYTEPVEKFRQALLDTGAYLDPYALLPEDPRGLQPGLDTVKVLSCTEDFATASLNQIRRYFVICFRGERFCDGHIAGQFESGHIVAALRRIRELLRAM